MPPICGQAKVARQTDPLRERVFGVAPGSSPSPAATKERLQAVLQAL